MSTQHWNSLPAEMKLAIFDRLDLPAIISFSLTNKSSYSLCVPYTFQSVKLNDFTSIQQFLDYVPSSYLKHIHQLEICTKNDSDEACWAGLDPPSVHPRTDAVASLLLGCPRLETLSLRLAGSLEKKIVPCFSHMSELRELAISNWGEESNMPISERLVVSIAASIPGLQQLSLDHITRSTLHAPELIGVYPYVPLVAGDEDIPDHPTLGAELSLPSLLRIPSLRKLTIRDTHLGDTRWATTPVDCRLETLNLGSCYHESDEFNTICTERIMAAVGPTIDEFALTTALSDEQFTKSTVTPLKCLRKLHISPYFPLESVVDTMSTLAGSPIESLSMQCFRDDAVEVCASIEEFLNLRVERGPEFYDKLARIDISVVADPASDEEDDAMSCDASSTSEDGADAEWRKAARQLQDYCNDLRLSSAIVGVSVLPQIPGVGRGSPAAHHHVVARCPLGADGERLEKSVDIIA